MFLRYRSLVLRFFFFIGLLYFSAEILCFWVCVDLINNTYTLLHSSIKRTGAPVLFAVLNLINPCKFQRLLYQETTGRFRICGRLSALLRIKFFYDLRKKIVYLVIVQLAGACIGMTASAVLKTQVSDVELGSLIDDGFTDHNGCILFLEAPGHVNGDLSLGIHSVDHEAVSSVNNISRSFLIHNHNLATAP